MTTLTRSHVLVATPRWRVHLFLTVGRDGLTGDSSGLTAQAIKSITRRLSIDTGLHVHPHGFRYTFAHHPGDGQSPPLAAWRQPTDWADGWRLVAAHV